MGKFFAEGRANTSDVLIKPCAFGFTVITLLREFLALVSASDKN